MSQHLRGTPVAACTGRKQSRPRSAWLARDLGQAGMLLGLGLGAFSAPASAQSRGTLQVAAQVLEAQASQLALAQGLTAVRLGTGSPEGTSLASVKFERMAVEADRTRSARLPRATVTISFLRN